MHMYAMTISFFISQGVQSLFFWGFISLLTVLLSPAAKESCFFIIVLVTGETESPNNFSDAGSAILRKVIQKTLLRTQKVV